LNDFEDLPEPALAPAIAEPVDADTSIEFDPEFDKL
jgi:hypothetical protein